MQDAIIRPRYTYAQGVPNWDVSAVARLIADATLTEEKALGQIRRFAQRYWIPTVGRRGTGKNAANLFGPAAVAGAKVLSVLTELGVDSEVVGRAAPALYEHGNWRLGLEPEGEHPVLRVIADARIGVAWLLQIEVRRGDYTGVLFVRPTVYEAEGEAPPPWKTEPGVLPRATITLDLTALLLPLHDRFMAAIGGAELVPTMDLVKVN